LFDWTELEEASFKMKFQRIRNFVVA